MRNKVALAVTMALLGVHAPPRRNENENENDAPTPPVPTPAPERVAYPSRTTRVTVETMQRVPVQRASYVPPPRVPRDDAELRVLERARAKRARRMAR